MTNRQIVANAVANWIGFAVQLVVAFFMSPILVHGLGAPRYGVWSLVESVLAYLMLFDLGVAASVVRYVARFEANGDLIRLNRVFSHSIKDNEPAPISVRHAFSTVIGRSAARYTRLHRVFGPQALQIPKFQKLGIPFTQLIPLAPAWWGGSPEPRRTPSSACRRVGKRHGSES